VNADPEATKPAIIDTHKPGSRLVKNAVPVPTEDTACFELMVWLRATTAEPEALEAWADDEAGSRT
jgi:hypothetical protein